MPGLINAPHLTDASSPKAGEGGNFSKYISADKVADEIPPPSLRPRPSVSQPVKVHSAIRLKQVTDPYGAIGVRGRLYCDVTSTERMVPNYSSNGIEHDPSSVCLAAMVNEFMENGTSFGQCGRARCNCRRGNAGADGCPDCDIEDSKSSIRSEIVQAFEGLVRCGNDSEAILLTDVIQFLGSIAGEMSSMCVDDAVNPTHLFLKRTLMKLLRRAGYNAAICKCRWDHSCGIPSGDYEYIDVLGEDNFRKCERLIVDIDFRAQFEIARPTVEYSTVWQLLPPIFVGKPERLQRIITSMSEAAKKSLKLRGLHLPPWRKPTYLKAKWFSPYRRTSNDLTYSCREGDIVATVEFRGIAERGPGLDARCGNELEITNDAGPAFFMRKISGKREEISERKGHTKWEASEEVLWSANRCSKEREKITVMATDWQPPAVVPRSTQKPGKVIGLASVLKQAGLAESQRTTSKEAEMLSRAA